MDAAARLWTASDDADLLEGVRQFLLYGKKSIPWRHMYDTVRASLPGRTLWSITAHFRGRAQGEEGDEGDGDGDGQGGNCAPWTQRESAVLRAAVEAAQRRPKVQQVKWRDVQRLKPALAARSMGALAVRYRVLQKKPAGKAMLEEAARALEEGAGAAGAGAAPSPPPPPPPPPLPRQQQQPSLPPQQQLTPFHMLHSLRSQGCIDEETLRVCWRAAAEAQRL